MDESPPIPLAPQYVHLDRAGVWRRAASIILDYLIITLPLQVLAVVLYAQSNGHIQNAVGFPMTLCVQLNPASANAIAPQLPTPPPKDWNYALDCTSTLLGWPHARALVFGKLTVSEGARKDVSLQYPVNQGSPAPPIDWGWVSHVSLSLYWLIALLRFGRTLGMRIVRVRLIETADPLKRGISFSRLLYRYLLFALPIVPLALAFAWWGAGVLDLGFYFLLFIPMMAAHVWILCSIIAKVDPYYDHGAGTAMIIETAAPRQADA